METVAVMELIKYADVSSALCSAIKNYWLACLFGISMVLIGLSDNLKVFEANEVLRSRITFDAGTFYMHKSACDYIF